MQIPKNLQKDWNIFQGKMRILRKKQREILARFRARLEAERVEKLRQEIKR